MQLEVGGRSIEITHPDKVLFPDDGITKAELVRYYQRMADRMLPHLRGRPLTLRRFPDGIAGEGFYQKQASAHFPSWIRRVEVDKEGGTVAHVVCDDAATLVYLAGQAMITPHVWLSREGSLRAPDRMIFDFDPPDDGEASLADLRFAVRATRGVLAQLELDGYLMTTGSSGFHVLVPLRPEHGFDTVRGLARDVARLLADRERHRLTVAMRKAERGRRIFIDYLRNGYAQTAVVPYSLRARLGAPVATPLSWDELDRAEPRSYNLGNIFRRLGQKADPWTGLAECGQSLESAPRTRLLSPSR